MKPIGMILIGAGILALIYTGFNYTTTKRVADIGPVKIDKEQNHRVYWPPITGVLLLLSGTILMVVNKNK